MTAHQYPFFESGQTLTAADLNMLREFLHARDRLVGRMTGFGVNCGLGGTVSGSTLTIQPGLAIEQYGEPLVLPAARQISLAPPAMTPSYDFIDRERGGFSVVLEATDTEVPAPDCGEGDCAGHATLHTGGVALRTVAGRVSGTRMDFAGEELLGAQPMVLKLDSTPIGDYEALRNAVANRLETGSRPLVDPTLIAKLRATSIAAGDLPGVKGYKCGWLNMVLFATLDLLRAKALLELRCDRETTRPGVVLGWVRQVDAAWVFECAYRHAWEPPRGLVEAFHGGSCDNPVAQIQEELEALLAGYAPPDPAGPGQIDPSKPCQNGQIRVRGECVTVVYPPPKELPQQWSKHWRFDRLGPIWNPPDVLWKRPHEVYEIAGLGFFQDGIIGTAVHVGQKASAVRHDLGVLITAKRGVPDIRVVRADALENLHGYLPSGGCSPSDAIVLVTDANDNILSTGRVPAVLTTRNVGAALPQAERAVARAEETAEQLNDITIGVKTRIGEAEQKVLGLRNEFTTLQGSFQEYKGGTFDTSGYGVRIAKAEELLRQFERVQSRVSTVEGKVDVLAKQPPRDTKAVDTTLGRGIAEFARTTVDAMRSLPEVSNPNFQRYTAAADRARAELEAAVATDDRTRINEATLTVLGTVRTMVKASGVAEEHGRLLDAQLRDLGGLFT